MPGEPSAHEGHLNLSPGRPKTRFSSGVRCICCQQSAQIGDLPQAPLEWRRKRGHDAPKKSAGGGGLTGDLVGASSAHIWVWGIAELKMQNKLASFGHRKARIRPLELALKERYLAHVSFARKRASRPSLEVKPNISSVGRAPVPSIMAVSIVLELPRAASLS